MLSRRNIRIKVMQMLYSMNRDQKLNLEGALKQYRQSINRSFELYLFNLYFFSRIAAYAVKDAERKMAKLLPSEEDKLFTAKLYENKLMQSIFNNEEVNRLFGVYKMESRLDKDAVRLVYVSFAKTEEYRNYVNQEDSSAEDHCQLLLALYKHCINEESFTETLEDKFPNWIDDKSLVVGALKKTIKALPADETFFEEYRPTPETTVDFGEVLLSRVTRQDEELLNMIEPVLKNWDADRVAIIDMILLKMALIEFIYFPTIPTKVTLNEFVEISKMYSTDKSKDFINGILDRLLKKLHGEGKINKEGRGLMND